MKLYRSPPWRVGNRMCELHALMLSEADVCLKIEWDPETPDAMLAGDELEQYCEGRNHALALAWAALGLGPVMVMEPDNHE